MYVYVYVYVCGVRDLCVVRVERYDLEMTRSRSGDEEEEIDILLK